MAEAIELVKDDFCPCCGAGEEFVVLSVKNTAGFLAGGETKFECEDCGCEFSVVYAPVEVTINQPA